MRFKRLLNFTFILIIVAVSSAFSSESPSFKSTLSLYDRMYIVSKTYSSIKTYFAHWQDVPEFSIESAYRKYLKKAIETEDRFSFDLLMMEFIVELKNGHSWYQDRWLWKNFGQPLGFCLRYISGKWVITESYISELRRGDIIEKIDDIEFEEFYIKNKKYINASSDIEARLKFPFRVFLFPEKFTIETADGRKITIERKTQKFKRPERKTTGKWIKEGDVAFIKIPGFGSSEFEKKAIDYIKKFSRAKAIIVDVRGNGGGNTPGELIDALQDKPYRFWTESTPVNFSLFKAYQEILKMYGKQLPENYKTSLEMFSAFFGNSHLIWTPKFNKPEKSIYKGKLILLVDRACASACEDFVLPFKDNKKAIIIGERTMGSTGQPYVFQFNGGISIGVGTKRAYFPDGSPFEGRGIEPDIKVEPSIEDIKSGRDVVLEKAVELANRK